MKKYKIILIMIIFEIVIDSILVFVWIAGVLSFIFSNIYKLFVPTIILIFGIGILVKIFLIKLLDFFILEEIKRSSNLSRNDKEKWGKLINEKKVKMFPFYIKYYKTFKSGLDSTIGKKFERRKNLLGKIIVLIMIVFFIFTVSYSIMVIGYRNIARNYWREGNLEKAIICYTKALNMTSKIPILSGNKYKYYYELARVYYDKKDFEKSALCFEKAIELDKFNPHEEYYYYLANIYYRKGFYSKAITYFKKVANSNNYQWSKKAKEDLLILFR